MSTKGRGTVIAHEHISHGPVIVCGVDVALRRLLIHCLHADGMIPISGGVFVDKCNDHFADVLRNLAEFCRVFFEKINEVSSQLGAGVVLVYENPVPPSSKEGGHLAYARLNNALGVLLSSVPEHWGIWGVSAIKARYSLCGVRDKATARKAVENKVVNTVTTAGVHYIVRVLTNSGETWGALSTKDTIDTVKKLRVWGDYIDSYIVALYAAQEFSAKTSTEDAELPVGGNAGKRLN